MTKHNLSLTVGITTCYGDESLVQTVKSLRSSVGVYDFPIIVVADRTPIKESIKNKLAKMNVQLIWNKVEGSQFKKIKQIVELCSTDTLILTQDDISFSSETISSIEKAFNLNPRATMITTRVMPLLPKTYIESIITSEVRIHDRIARYWNEGKNFYASSGRCYAFLTKFIKRFRIPENVVNGDTFMYLENLRVYGKQIHQSDAIVYIRCPQQLKDQVGPSSRFQFSKEEMKKYFHFDLAPHYRIPIFVKIRAVIEELIQHPITTMLYPYVFLYTRIKRPPTSVTLDPVWRVDLSTKKII